MIRIAAIPLTAVLMLVGAVSLAGQGTVDFRFGATDGTVSAGQLDRFDQIPRRSFSLGASVTLALREHFGMRFGGALTGKGTTYDVSSVEVNEFYSEDFPGTLTYERTYIELTVLGRAVLPLWNRRLSLYALAGAALGFSRRCQVTWRGTRVPGRGDEGIDYGLCELPVRPDSHIQLDAGADLGAVGGIGADVEFWDWRWSLEVLHTLGLTSDTPAGNAVRNRVRTIQFGISLPFR